MGFRYRTIEEFVKKKKLGEVLRDRGKISAEDLLQVVSEQQGKMLHLGELMLERGLVKKGDLAAALEEVSHVPYLDCSEVVPDPEAIKLVQRATAERCVALPIRMEQERLSLHGCATGSGKLDELRFSTGMEISPVWRSVARFSKRSQNIMAAANGKPHPSSTLTTKKTRKGKKLNSSRLAPGSPTKKRFKEMQADQLQRKTPAVRLVSEIIHIAMAKHASDIHIDRERRRRLCGSAWTVCCVTFSPSRGTCKPR